MMCKERFCVGCHGNLHDDLSVEMQLSLLFTEVECKNVKIFDRNYGPWDEYSDDEYIEPWPIKQTLDGSNDCRLLYILNEIVPENIVKILKFSRCLTP